MINVIQPINNNQDLKIKNLLHEINVKYDFRKVLSIFYKYIEKSDIVNPELKNQAFIYWGDYFSSITFIIFGVIALLVLEIQYLYTFSTSNLKIIIMIIILLFLILNYLSINYGKVKPRRSRFLFACGWRSGILPIKELFSQEKL